MLTSSASLGPRPRPAQRWRQTLIYLAFPDRGTQKLAIWDRRVPPCRNGSGHSLRTATPDRTRSGNASDLGP
eukprot:15451298-Alexandrium_andersonii.AAC.1